MSPVAHILEMEMRVHNLIARGLKGWPSLLVSEDLGMECQQIAVTRQMPRPDRAREDQRLGGGAMALMIALMWKKRDSMARRVSSESPLTLIKASVLAKTTTAGTCLA